MSSLNPNERNETVEARRDRLLESLQDPAVLICETHEQLDAWDPPPAPEPEPAQEPISVPEPAIAAPVPEMAPEPIATETTTGYEEDVVPGSGFYFPPLQPRRERQTSSILLYLLPTVSAVSVLAAILADSVPLIVMASVLTVLGLIGIAVGDSARGGLIADTVNTLTHWPKD